MAKPIRATPTLVKSEVDKFVKSMVEVAKRKANKVEKDIIKAIS